jgi:N6-adenosine-specific RNA methylase IME4
MTDTALARVTTARQLLFEASTAAQAKKVSDIAKSAEIFALKQGSKEAAEFAHEIHADALRLEGQYLQQQEKAKPPGDNQHKKKLRLPNDTEAPTLAQQGISKRESVQAQAVAEVAKSNPEMFEAFRKRKTTLKKLVQSTKKKVQKAATKSEVRNGFVVTLSGLVGQKFGCIYADPPWQYQNQGTRGSTDNHYSTMTVDDICALPVKDLAAEASHLHLWTTNAFLFECPRIFEAWGFEFKSSFIWVKPEMGMGNYWRNSHEILLLGVRGGLVGQDKSLMSWVKCGRGKHSAKPDVIRNMIERLSPGPRLEMFGRRAVPGWVVFGNEILEML